ASLVKRACKGLGTDDGLIISTLCGKTKPQLEAIDQETPTSLNIQEYREMYGRSLGDQLAGEVSGNYKKLMQFAVMEKDEFDAHCLSEAIDGCGTDEEVLIEIFATRSNEELAAMKDKWEGMKDDSLVDRLGSEVGGDHLQTLLLNILGGSREECTEADEDAAAEQAEKLYEAGIGKTFGTDEEAFVEVFSQANWVQMQSIKEKYEAEHGMSLEKAIKKEFGGDLEDCLVAMLQPPLDYFCTLLNKATKGFGTNEGVILRVLGGSDRHHMKAICERYFEKYDETLADTLKSELRGKFEKACLRWIEPDIDPTGGIESQISAAPLEEGCEDEDAIASMIALLEAENEALKNYMASVDAHEIHDACDGIGTDDSRLISVLCHRTKTQIERIDMAYRKEYEGRTLRDLLESELSGDMEDFMVYVQMESQEFDATMLKKAMSGIGTKESLLVQVICTRSAEQLSAAKELYEGRNDESLVDRINGEVDGTLQSILLTLVNGEKDTSEEADAEVAEQQADQLHEAADGIGTKEEVFVEILAKSSPAQIEAIKDIYETKYEKSLGKCIKGEFGGDCEDALLALVSSPVDYYCMQLKDAMSGFGTNEGIICRVLGGVDKATVQEIRDRYMEKYDTELSEALKSELHGSFKKAALAWVAVEDVGGGL
ncbi:unnamed protein product, partial [Chrysoparadoxa australica]